MALLYFLTTRWQNLTFCASYGRLRTRLLKFKERKQSLLKLSVFWNSMNKVAKAVEEYPYNESSNGTVHFVHFVNLRV